MKKLKFDHEESQRIQDARSFTVWRIYDDQQLSVSDRVQLVDKINVADPTSWKLISVAIVEQLIEKRLGDVSPDDYDAINTYASSKEMINHFRSVYGPEINESTPVKILKLTKTDPIKSDNVVDESSGYKQISEVKLYADGGSRGNPGPSASGFVIVDDKDTVVVEKGIYLGVTTNNQAEYQALKFGLEEALKLGAREIHVYMDSLLVINQMTGKFNIKNRDLWPIHEAIKTLAKKFSKLMFTHVPRELNQLADAQVNLCLDAEALKQV
jgi:ribonuclease HI